MPQLCQHLQSAVAVLVTEGPVKVRLAEAYARHLQELERQELPEEIREEFNRLREALHQHRPVCGETAVEATVRKMSPQQADEYAASIVGMLVTLLRADPSAERFRVVEGGAEVAEAEPPAFLARRS